MFLGGVPLTCEIYLNFYYGQHTWLTPFHYHCHYLITVLLKLQLSLLLLCRFRHYDIHETRGFYCASEKLFHKIAKNNFTPYELVSIVAINSEDAPLKMSSSVETKRKKDTLKLNTGIAAYIKAHIKLQ